MAPKLTYHRNAKDMAPNEYIMVDGMPCIVLSNVNHKDRRRGGFSRIQYEELFGAREKYEIELPKKTVCDVPYVNRQIYKAMNFDEGTKQLTLQNNKGATHVINLGNVPFQVPDIIDVLKKTAAEHSKLDLPPNSCIITEVASQIDNSST